MNTTTKIISLTLMGGALAFIGWQCMRPRDPNERHHHAGVRHRTTFFPFFFHSWGGGSRGPMPSVGGTHRGGFGTTGHGVGG